MSITPEWRIKEFHRMTKDGGTYLENTLNISKLHMGLEFFIQAISSSNKRPFIQKELSKEGTALIKPCTPHDSLCYDIKIPWIF